ncbi:MAG: emp24/gp25L/p24 family protein [Chloroflexi bacterium]|nr:emp24/gp25L/p24 family protein [Chloroflexota bacterium]
MVKKIGAFLPVLLALMLIACDVLPGISPPTPLETQFTVEPGKKHSIAVMVREGRSLEGTFSISGGENFIDFSIRGPNGELSYGVVRAVGGRTFEMTADKEGTYTMWFDNSFSFGSARQISLRYIVR